MPHAVLGLGSNLGARRALFSCARQLLSAVPQLRIVAASRLYHTPPLGPPQPMYLNGALRVEWPGQPGALLAHTQRIEALLQRTREVRWGPRTLDIDILDWSAGEVSEPGLHVPHRELTKRAFALAPLLDVAPELAPRLAPTLSALGGAPPLHETWEERAVRSNGGSQTALCQEPEELLSAFASAWGQLVAPGLVPSRVLPFQVPAGPLAAQCAALQTQLTRALAEGFAALGGALTGASGAGWLGLLVAAAVPAREAPQCTFRLEQNAAGMSRATLHLAGSP